jgi:hypothetical protein
VTAQPSGSEFCREKSGIGFTPDETGNLAHKNMPDGRHACVSPLTFSRARIVIADDDRHYQLYDGW